MHQTVLKQIAIEYLNPQDKKAWYIDATFGGGGHTAALLEEGLKVIAFDFDELAIISGQSLFANEIKSGQLILVRENFTKIKSTVDELRKNEQLSPTDKILGVLFDFGTNSDQLMSAERGFSFAGEGNLDMRLDQRLGVTARDLLLALPEKELARLFEEYGGEHQSKAVARKIIDYRKNTPIDIAFKSNQDLVNLIFSAKGRRPQGNNHIHPATKVFQALRIAVNNELENTATGIEVAFDSLYKGGRLVTIAFHEGEDRPAKHFMRKMSQDEQGELLTKKPISPPEDELEINNRARSAKLRAIEKIV